MVFVRCGPPHRHILRRARTQVRAFFSPAALRPVARTDAQHRLREILLLRTLLPERRTARAWATVPQIADSP